MSLLLNGDCLEEITNIDDNFVDFIFCDLPYGATACDWDSKIDLKKLWVEFLRIKKMNTPIIFTTTTKYGVELINSAPKKCPFRYDLVWMKSAPAGFLSAKKMPMRKHEMIYVFYEKLPLYDLSSHNCKIIKDSSKKNKSNELTSNQIIKQDCYEKNKTNDDLRRGHRDKKYEPPLPNSLLEIKSTRGKHSTEKPTELIEWLLKYYSKEEDVVLDPTMGSGSTGVACKNMNRNFIGIEKDEEIYETAFNRINN